MSSVLLKNHILEETMVSLKEHSDTPILYHCSVIRLLIEGQKVQN